MPKTKKEKGKKEKKTKEIIFEVKSLNDLARLCCLEQTPLPIFAVKKEGGYELICRYYTKFVFRYKENFKGALPKYIKYFSENFESEEDVEFSEKIESIRYAYSPIIFLKDYPKAGESKIKFIEVEDTESLLRLAEHEMLQENFPIILEDGKKVYLPILLKYIYFTEIKPEYKSFFEKNFVKVSEELPVLKHGKIRIIHLSQVHQV